MSAALGYWMYEWTLLLCYKHTVLGGTEVSSMCIHKNISTKLKPTINHCTYFMHVWMPHFDGILPKGPYPPCLRMADRALLAEYPRYTESAYIIFVKRVFSHKVKYRFVLPNLCKTRSHDAARAVAVPQGNGGRQDLYTSWWRHQMEIFSASLASEAELWCFIWYVPE